MANRKRNEQREREWRSTLASFQRSGLSVRDFCQQEAVPESAFYFWRRTLRQRDAKPEARPVVPAFLPVAVQREVDGGVAQVTIDVGTGLTIRFPESVSPERIAAVVRALREESPA